MTIYQWLCLLGIPALVLTLFQYGHRQIRSARSANRSLRSGMQALLRAQMITDYNKWMEKGYAPIYARENFENCWKQYHSLGANGVMDDIHQKFMTLPTETSEK
jgi:hypothetical protein